MNKEERLQRAKETKAEDSAFEVLRGDSDRVALIELHSGNEVQGETHLDQLAYQSLISGLRLAIKTLEDEAKRIKERPGGLSVYEPRVKKLEAQAAELIEVLVRFDF